MTAAAALARLQAIADPERARKHELFFKTGPGQYAEHDKFMGVTAPQTHVVVREFRSMPLREIERLLASEWHEARLLALLLMVDGYKRGAADVREAIYKSYLSHTTQINNWDLVDLSAPGIVGAHLLSRSSAVLTRLAKSASLWERRIAIIATQHFIRANQFDATLRIAKILLRDEHDLIHKAVGWMLREVGNRDRAVEQTFLDQHAHEMPRTMLRYAIEKFPPTLRAKYMRS